MTGLSQRVWLLASVLLIGLLVGPLSAGANAHYTPKSGDQFAYNETVVVGDGTGTYAGYTESTVINGSLSVTSVLPNGTESALYYNADNYQNNSGGQESWTSSGSFTFSAGTFEYVQGTDNQTGYTSPVFVWFYMNNSLSAGSTFTLLNSGMKVVTTSYNFNLETPAGSFVKAIFAEGNGSYQRDDAYGMFNATYNWKAYFDPSTGFIIGYVYTEQDSDGVGDGFTYVDTLSVTHTSYPLTPGAAPLGAPTGVAATPVNSTQINLAWTNPSGSVTDNHVYEYSGSSCSGPATPVDLGRVATAYSTAGLASSSTYSFEVTASSSAGEGPRSACVSATTAAASSSSSGSGGLSSTWILLIVLLVVIVVVVIIAVAISRSRRNHPLPKHSATGRMTYTLPPMGPPPPGVHLTPMDQPAVQQIIIKETVKVNCRYCGALIDSTVEKCPFCGAART